MKPREISWTPRFRADVAAIPRNAALQLLKDMAEFAKTGAGDVRKLANDPEDRRRLRSGGYRALFVIQKDGSLTLTSAEHRKDAY